MADDGHIMDYSKITDQIFVGSDLCKGNICPIHGPEFKKLGVTVELNLSIEKKEMPPNEVDVYAWLPVLDGKAPNECQFAIGTALINEAVSTGNKVYVHCKNGHGRAPTIVAAYFIRYRKMSVEESFNKIKSARPEIHFEEAQIKALISLYKKWS